MDLLSPLKTMKYIPLEPLGSSTTTHIVRLIPIASQRHTLNTLLSFRDFRCIKTKSVNKEIPSVLFHIFITFKEIIFLGWAARLKTRKNILLKSEI
jgi:hypothetical protein